MIQKKQKKTGYTKTLKNPEIYDRFVIFMGIPRPFRKKVFGYKNEQDFAKKSGVDQTTLTAWKQREDYRKRLDKEHFKWLIDQQDIVYANMARGKHANTPAMVKLYLQYVKKWVERQEVENTGNMFITSKEAVDFDEAVKEEKKMREKEKKNAKAKE